MSRTHIVKEGEHLAQIAKAYGVSKDAIWDYPANEALRSHRRTCDLLNPGDQLVIPEQDTVLRAAETGRRHAIELQEDTVDIRVKLQDEFGEGLADIAFELLGPHGVLAAGRTDADGNVAATLPADVTRARLVLADIGTELELGIGALNPISCRSGVQQRLANLGYYQGAIDSDFGPKTRAALISFQACMDLATTGIADDATREALERCSGRTPLGLEADEDMRCGPTVTAEALLDERSDIEEVPAPAEDDDWSGSLDDDGNDDDGVLDDWNDEDEEGGDDDLGVLEGWDDGGNEGSDADVAGGRP